MTSYANQRALAIAVAVVLGLIGAIQLAGTATLGLTPQMMAWLGIASVGLGLLGSFLPNVRGRATDPAFLADRVSELPREQRLALASTLADRAEAETGGDRG